MTKDTDKHIKMELVCNYKDKKYQLRYFYDGPNSPIYLIRFTFHAMLACKLDKSSCYIAFDEESNECQIHANKIIEFIIALADIKESDPTIIIDKADLTRVVSAAILPNLEKLKLRFESIADEVFVKNFSKYIREKGSDFLNRIIDYIAPETKEAAAATWLCDFPGNKLAPLPTTSSARLRR